jgi:hypothetical protein
LALKLTIKQQSLIVFEELTISNATVLGVADEILVPLVDRINAGNGSGSGLTTSQQSTRGKKALYQTLLKGN